MNVGRENVIPIFSDYRLLRFSIDIAQRALV
jgi:hypothetical protein